MEVWQDGFSLELYNPDTPFTFWGWETLRVHFGCRKVHFSRRFVSMCATQGDKLFSDSALTRDCQRRPLCFYSHWAWVSLRPLVRPSTPLQHHHDPPLHARTFLLCDMFQALPKILWAGGSVLEVCCGKWPGCLQQDDLAHARVVFTA